MAARLPDPSSPHAVADGMFRALVWLRLVVTLNMLGLNWLRRDNLDHPAAGLALIAFLVLWSGFASWAYAAARRRTPALLIADLAVAAAAILVSPAIKGPDINATIPGFWVMTVVLVWGVRWRWLGGLIAAAVIALADLSIRLPDITQTNYANVFLLLIGGPIVGYLCGILRTMATERDEAQRAAAYAEERARLARAVHDGTLQVLALMQRRGPDLGPVGEELGRLAGEQEVALRALVQASSSGSAGSSARTPGGSSGGAPAAGLVDLAALLGQLVTRRTPVVSVATPGHAVLLPAAVASELVAAVGACLDNVAVHVGEDAPAWVLLEELADRVVVSVRDDGPGIPPGRVEEAETDGRLGVAESIRGRLRDIGGTAELHTGEHGTEWELTV
jgi:signal transduction histidine kinase